MSQHTNSMIHSTSTERVRQPVPFNDFAKAGATIDPVANNHVHLQPLPAGGYDSLSANFFQTTQSVLTTNQGDLRSTTTSPRRTGCLAGIRKCIRPSRPSIPSSCWFGNFGSARAEPGAWLVALVRHEHRERFSSRRELREDLHDNPTPASIGNFGEEIGNPEFQRQRPGPPRNQFQRRFCYRDWQQRNRATVCGHGISVWRLADHYTRATRVPRGLSISPVACQFSVTQETTDKLGSCSTPASGRSRWCQRDRLQSDSSSYNVYERKWPSRSGLLLGLPQLTGRGSGIGWGQRANRFAGYVHDDGA
jgi:hypothetical protein